MDKISLNYDIVERSVKRFINHVFLQGLHRTFQSVRCYFYGMNNDLDLIIKQYPEDQNVLRVYAIGDVHVGSPQFDERAIRKKIKIIHDDPCAAVCLCGDLGDYGLKNSVSNVYQATLSPREQMDYIYELFLPVADKIAACVPGNHEDRITKEVGICPMLTICSRLGCPEVYRESVAITKYIFGRWKGTVKPMSFIGITLHGSTQYKHRKHIACYDGVDLAISGHCHAPTYVPHGRIRIDSHNASAQHVPYKEIVVDANLTPGGYGIKKEYEIAPPPELQYIELSGYREPNNKRTKRRVMDFHSIQI